METQKKLTELDLLNQREQIQEDIRCLLDGIDEEILDNACQIIVDQFEILIQKLKLSVDQG
jgi:hypothetical protein